MKHPVMKKIHTIQNNIQYLLRTALFLILCYLPYLVAGQGKYMQQCEYGISDYTDNRMPEAINEFTQAIDQKPGTGTAYCLRAYTYFTQKNYQQGIQDAAKAISLDVNDPWPYLIRGIIYAEQKNDQQAIADLTQAILMEKETGSLLARHAAYMRASCYFNMSAYASAISDLSIYGAHPYLQKEFNSLLARSYMHNNQYAEAAQLFDQMVQKDPQDKEALFYKGYCLLKSGDTPGAKSVMAQFREWNAGESAIFVNNVSGFFDLEKRVSIADGLYRAALEEISASKGSGTKALVSIQIGSAFHLLDSAYRYLPAAEIDKSGYRTLIMDEIMRVYPQLKEKPEIPETARKYIVQALAATESKNYLAAESFYAKAQQIAPWAPIIYNNMAFLMEKNERYAEAISNMEKYITLSPNEKDTRSAQDKIYEWELKVGQTNAPVKIANKDLHNALMDAILSNDYVPGDYLVGFGIGGAFGYQANKNESLGLFWDNLSPAPDYAYSDKIPVIYSADAELIIKPWVQLGFGGQFKAMGGIGMHRTSLETDHELGAFTLNYGPFVRYYFPSKQTIAPLFFGQAGFGRSMMMAESFVYGDTEYSIYTTSALTGTAPYLSLMLGMAGRSYPTSNGYVHLSIEYVRAVYEEIEYEITYSSNFPAAEGITGTLMEPGGAQPVTAIYSGFMLKFLFGFALP